MDWQGHRDKDKRYHDAIGAEYDAVVVTPRAILDELLFGKIERTVRAGRRMLDVGCGTGHMLLRFGSSFRELTGVDHSRTMLNAATANLAEKNLKAELIEADALRFITEATPSYDFITCVGFLHHLIPDTIPGVVKRLAQLLSPPTGHMLIAEPIAVEASLLPAAIAHWNTLSLAARNRYSQMVEDPDEAPISRDLLYDSLHNAGLKVLVEKRAWEVFPHHDPPSLKDKLMTRYFKFRHGSSGNVMALLAAPGPG